MATDIDARVDALLEQLSLEEKAALCSGRDFWHLRGIARLGLPAIMLTDGPHGLRKQKGAADHVGLNESVPATCFPTASGLASSWNRELLRAVGVALGGESRQEGVSVLLGPGVNIKRNPLGGRNFEYYSEDPCLAGELAAAWVQGVQSQGVGASLKHYAANNHETGRMVVDVVVDQRTLREIYLPAFETTVRDAQPWTVMCAYNKVNGTYLAEHRELLTSILRDEWGFEGLVLSDWGAVNDRVEGIRNGLDLEMPASGEVNTRRIAAAVEDGTLGRAELDAAVGRVLELILKSIESLRESTPVSPDAHHALARTAAEEACVLLKNDADLLPLQARGKLAVIGALATQTRYQGSGSSQINPTRLEQPLEQIRLLVGDDASVGYAAGYSLTGEDSSAMTAEALALAQDSDAVILIAGLPPEYESEGFDRRHMRLPASQLELITALAAVSDRLVVVLQNGAPVELPFATHVRAILEVNLGGQAGASALANILFGTANPSGKLAETFPRSLADVPSQPWFPGEPRQSQYREGIWVGYRYFDTAKVPVAFPFGHGLSYSRFEYSGLRLAGRESGNGYAMEDGDQLLVEFDLSNSGSRDGAEVAQLYVGQRNASVHRPHRELKAFDKIFLRAGETKTVRLRLAPRAFAFWSVTSHRWVVESDQFDICVGASVADIRLHATVAIQADAAPGEQDAALAPYRTPRKLAFDDAAFAALLGHSIPEPVPIRPFHLNSRLAEVDSTWLGRKLRSVVETQVSKALGGNTSETARRMVEAIIDEMPLRNLVTQSQGTLSPGVMRALIHIMNGDWAKLLRNAPIASR